MKKQKGIFAGSLVTMLLLLLLPALVLTGLILPAGLISPGPALAQVTFDQLSQAQPQGQTQTQPQSQSPTQSSQLPSSLDSNFNPNRLIDDKVFSDTQTFGGAEGVQKFLDTYRSPLADTAPAFLAQLKEPSSVSLKTALGDPRPNLGRLRTAAELIWDAAQYSGLNPQVILVTLNKEQGLITAQRPINPATFQTALDHAMGFGCPDSGGCSDLFPSFYYQLFGNLDSDGNRYLGAAASLMKSFNTPGGRGPAINGGAAQVGETISLSNTQGAPYNCPATQTVTLSNKATAALYRYTPHVCNGNYNFYKFSIAWFKYPNGTLLKLKKKKEVYIIQNGVRLLVPEFVAKVRGLNLSSALTVSPNEIENYQVDKPLGPVDNTIVKVADQPQLYVFISNIKHPASEFVIKQRGLNLAAVLSVSPADAKLFEQGPVLTPNDGTVLRGQTNFAVYLVDKGSLKLFSAFTFGQQQAVGKMQVIPDSEIDSYPKAGFVAPLNGSLIKSDKDNTVFEVFDSLKHPISGELFKNRAFSFKNVATLSSDEVNALAPGTFVTPSERTFFKITQTGQLYIFKAGSKHLISAFVAKQRGITPDYTFDQGEARDWLEGIAIPPRDGTLVKGNADGTVYVVEKGQLRGLTGAAFSARRYNFKNVNVLPQQEVDAYAKGEAIAK